MTPSSAYKIIAAVAFGVILTEYIHEATGEFSAARIAWLSKQKGQQYPFLDTDENGERWPNLEHLMKHPPNTITLEGLAAHLKSVWEKVQGGQADRPTYKIPSGLREVGLIKELQQQFHRITSSQLFTDEKLDVPLKDLDVIGSFIRESQLQLQTSGLKTQVMKRAQYLEQNILLRLRELIIFRKNTEQSLKNAIAEPLKSPLPDASEADMIHRRNNFASGARTVWSENSKRLKRQITNDLSMLDQLIATAML